MNTEFLTPFEWFIQMYNQNLDGRDLKGKFSSGTEF